MISRGMLGWGVHGMIFVALIVNLWFGGDVIEALFGRPGRGLFEIALILGYMTLVVGMRAPLPWRRSDDGAPGEPTAGERREDRRE